MKRLILILMAVCLGGLVSVALAGDYHSGSTLVCSDCHTAHWSIQPGHDAGFHPELLGPSGPYDYLLLNHVNELCLSCHNENSIAPDVFGDNHGKYSGTVRRAGGLNATAGHLANDVGYTEVTGHSLWSSATPPGNGGAYVPPADGLECTSCHAQHGHKAFQYRNLRMFVSTDTLDYAITTNNLNKAAFERAPRSYADADVDFNEPHQWSDYAKWCGGCHTNFHGVGGDANMGSVSGGYVNGGIPWKRHPVADVNIGAAASYVSSLTQFNSHVNRVKVMDSQGLWNGTTADNTVTPSCFSCHRSHGDKNPFGLIYLLGNGVNPVTEEGDGAQYKNLCRQCHVQGADS